MTRNHFFVLDKDFDFPIIAGGEERVVVVTDYTYHPARRQTWIDPPEPAELDDIECRWADTGKALTSGEWLTYGKEIEENCWKRLEEEAESAADAAIDQALEQWRDAPSVVLKESKYEKGNP